MKTKPVTLATLTWLSVILFDLFTNSQLLVSAQSTPPTNATNLPIGTCTKDIPCINHACCNGETGLCGYDPSSDCAPGTCTSNCNAKAECGKFADPPNKECPLSVCCSQFGFCGTIEEFCGEKCQSNCDAVNIPSCDSEKSTATKRRIGYYEGWAVDRGCMAYEPEQIAAESLTHINFAFALINPSFEIIEMTKGDKDLWRRTTALKMKKPALKVFLSIGGWTFNDPPTQQIFSNMVGSEANTNIFIKSVLSIMETYAFDGIDVDWEYPSADDRGGIPTDKQNYVTFMSRVKDAFVPRKYGLTFTAPSSYWYLQHFDLPGMMKHADWVNIMTYDLHGTWDGDDVYIGYVVGSHTNLTEINQAFQLYWRVGVDPAQMVMGMGFYGRSFTLADPSCDTAGCAWTSGGKKGPCSDKSGTLMYSEIYSILNNAQKAPTIDEEAGVAYVTWDKNQWVSYDTDETFRIKMNYANDHCIGGTMIWSVDQDNNDYDALEALYPDSVGLGNPDDPIDSSESACYVSSCGAKSCYPDRMVTSVYYSPLDGQCDVEKGIPAVVCCPESTKIKRCTKRGYKDEKTSCVPQCDFAGPGEVLIALDIIGETTSQLCMGGHTALCCETDIPPVDCVLSKCSTTPDTSCPSDFSNFVTPLSTGDGVCPDGMAFGFCCKEPLPFANCKWEGSPPLCTDAVCDIGQVTLVSDPLGDGLAPCVGGKQRQYCCDPPVDLPVPFRDIFPDGTPEGSELFHVDFDDDVGGPRSDDGVPMSGTASTFEETEDENSGAFGEVFIDSPKAGSVSSMNLKSNWVLTQCDPKSDQPQKVLAYCSKPNDPGCQHVHIDGAEDTIIELPTSCGLGPYARVVSLGVHPDQNTLTSWHADQKPPSENLYLLHFDYNFAAIPESNGPIYMRADVTDMPGYWDSVVDSPPERKRWLKERSLEKRWWGAFKTWLSKINTVTTDQSQHRSFDWHDTWTIFHDEAHCEGPPQFDASLDISLSGQASLNARYGFYLQGTVVPPAVSAAYLYFSSDGITSATLTLKGEASVTYSSDRITFAKFGFPGLYYPGLLTVGPSLVIEGYITGELSISGEITTGVTYEFPSVNYALGKGGDDSIGPNVGLSADSVNDPEYAFGYNVELSGDISIHTVPTVQLGVSVLGGSLIDANAFIRADIQVGVALNGSVNDAVALKICVIPHFGVDLEGGVTGNILYWETGPLTHTFLSKDYTYGETCYDSEGESQISGRRSLSNPKTRVISASEGMLPKYDVTRKGARLVESHKGKVEREIEARLVEVEEPGRGDSNKRLSKRDGSVPPIPGIFSCPRINEQIGEENTDNDIYSDYPGDVDDDQIYRRSDSVDFENYELHVDRRADNDSIPLASLMQPVVDVSVPGCTNIKFEPYDPNKAGYNYYNLASPTTLDPLFKAHTTAVGYANVNTYGREHVYEMQLLSGFIGQLAQSSALWQNAAQNNGFCSWVDTYINKPSSYPAINKGTRQSVIDRLRTCVPSNSQSSIPGGNRMPWLESTANGMKAKAFGGVTIRKSSTFGGYSFSKKVFEIRAAAGVISYLNDGVVADQFVKGSTCVKNVWSDFFNAYKADPTVDAPNRANFDMVQTYLTYIRQKVQGVVPALQNAIQQMIGFYATSAKGANIAKQVDLNYGKLNPQGTSQVSANDLTNNIYNWARGQNLVGKITRFLV